MTQIRWLWKLCAPSLSLPHPKTHTHKHTCPASVRGSPGYRGPTSSKTGKIHKTLESEGRMEGIKRTMLGDFKDHLVQPSKILR